MHQSGGSSEATKKSSRATLLEERLDALLEAATGLEMDMQAFAGVMLGTPPALTSTDVKGQRPPEEAGRLAYWVDRVELAVEAVRRTGKVLTEVREEMG